MIRLRVSQPGRHAPVPRARGTSAFARLDAAALRGPRRDRHRPRVRRRHVPARRRRDRRHRLAGARLRRLPAATATARAST